MKCLEVTLKVFRKEIEDYEHNHLIDCIEDALLEVFDDESESILSSKVVEADE